ncbi:MAG: hypothetical protein NUW37_05585 [Planctomycetes bacterium]|nr:hypothetical protein [Planctomycetota bacterium]
MAMQVKLSRAALLTFVFAFIFAGCKTGPGEVVTGEDTPEENENSGAGENANPENSEVVRQAEPTPTLEDLNLTNRAAPGEPQSTRAGENVPPRIRGGGVEYSFPEESATAEEEAAEIRAYVGEPGYYYYRFRALPLPTEQSWIEVEAGVALVLSRRLQSQGYAADEIKIDLIGSDMIVVGIKETDDERILKMQMILTDRCDLGVYTFPAEVWQNNIEYPEVMSGPGEGYDYHWFRVALIQNRGPESDGYVAKKERLMVRRTYADKLTGNNVSEAIVTDMGDGTFSLTVSLKQEVHADWRARWESKLGQSYVVTKKQDIVALAVVDEIFLQGTIVVSGFTDLFELNRFASLLQLPPLEAVLHEIGGTRGGEDE